MEIKFTEKGQLAAIGALRSVSVFLLDRLGGSVDTTWEEIEMIDRQYRLIPRPKGRRGGVTLMLRERREDD